MTAWWSRKASDGPDASVESEAETPVEEGPEQLSVSDDAIEVVKVGEAEVEPEPEPELEIDPETEPEPEREAEIEPEPETEIEPEAESEGSAGSVTTRKMRWSLFGDRRARSVPEDPAPDPEPGHEPDRESDQRAEDEPEAEVPAEADHDEASDEEVEPPASHASHGRRRRFGRAHHRTGSPSQPQTRPASAHGVSDMLLLVAKRAGAVILIAAVLVGALWGLALGINAFARWNARRVAAQGGTGTPSENLLVIGVRDGVAIGFTALKIERDSDRVLGIAIPEGAFMEVPGQGFERIGASYDAGPVVSESAVSNYLGVPFPNYVALDGDTYQALLQDQNIAAITGKIASTDLTAGERASVIGFFKQVSAEDVWIVPLPVRAMTVGSERFFEPQSEQVADLLLQWWGVRADQQKARTRVIVYDGVGTTGLASEAAQQLIRAGFQVVDSGSADHLGYEKTIILVYHAPAEAQAVRDALGVGAIQAQSAPQEITDMIVILGADYLPPVSTPSNVPTTTSNVSTEGAR